MLEMDLAGQCTERAKRPAGIEERLLAMNLVRRNETVKFVGDIGHHWHCVTMSQAFAAGQDGFKPECLERFRYERVIVVQVWLKHIHRTVTLRH